MNFLGDQVLNDDAFDFFPLAVYILTDKYGVEKATIMN
jgi:hypothetical protein